MSVSPEQLHELLKYCMEFAKTMLDDSGEFYPFGAVLGVDGKVRAVGGHDGSEKPKAQDIYQLLGESFAAEARQGTIRAAALAANVNIPAEYAPPAPDGLRVHLEDEGFSRFIYVPYVLQTRGLLKKRLVTEFLEPIAVQIPAAFFSGKTHA